MVEHRKTPMDTPCSALYLIEPKQFDYQNQPVTGSNPVAHPEGYSSEVEQPTTHRAALTCSITLVTSRRVSPLSNC